MEGPTLPRLFIVALHVLSLLLWIGSLVSITRVLASAEGETDDVRAKLAGAARKGYRAVASPWMGIAVITGIILVVTAPAHEFRGQTLAGWRWLFKQGFWHTKLLGVVLLLALHFVLGARVRRAERDGVAAPVARAMRGIQ